MSQTSEAWRGILQSFIGRLLLASLGVSVGISCGTLLFVKLRRAFDIFRSKLILHPKAPFSLWSGILARFPTCISQTS